MAGSAIGDAGECRRGARRMAREDDVSGRCSRSQTSRRDRAGGGLDARGGNGETPPAGAGRRTHAGERRRGDRRGASVWCRRVVRRRRCARNEEREKGHAVSCERAQGREVFAVSVVPWCIGEVMATATANGSLFGRRDPDDRGYFGEYGGRFVPETLVAPIEELTAGYLAAREDPGFQDELARLLKHYVGRPTPLYEARRLAAGTRVRVFLKREDLTHTGAHKINNSLGQGLLAKRMKKKRVVAET